MDQTIYRETWAEINLDTIGHNINQVKQNLPRDCQIIAVVKANAYGHGDVKIAQKALDSGATMLAVALLEEALNLREMGIEAPILVLGRVSPKGTIIASEKNITLTFYQQEWLQEVAKQPLKEPLHLHMKWDTGMGRSGIRAEEELTSILELIKCNDKLHLTGIYTHFATADEVDLTYFKKQRTRFKQFLTLFQEQWQEDVCVHIGNSAASIRFPNEMYDAVRLGVSMYGLYPGETVKKENKVDLKQTFSLHSQLVHVKRIQAGDSVGYGATYKANKDEWIGTLLIGYGDGWTRKLQGFSILIEGKRMPIVGRICMDQMMVRLDENYSIGTKATLIGKQGDDMVTIDDVATYLQTINYEIPCMINNRVPRLYV